MGKTVYKANINTGIKESFLVDFGEGSHTVYFSKEFYPEFVKGEFQFTCLRCLSRAWTDKWTDQYFVCGCGTCKQEERMGYKQYS